MADLERLWLLLKQRPNPLPKTFPDTRAVYALFGPEPTTTAHTWIRRLEAQEAALVEASALRAERVEDWLTRPPPKKKERPAVPPHSGPGSVEAALAALRWRLSRPGAKPLTLHRALYAHARAALRLQADEAEGAVHNEEWLAALGAPEIGVVPLIDAYLKTGDESPLAVALDLATEALDLSVRDTWAERTKHRVRQVSSALADAGPIVAAELDAFRIAFGNTQGSGATEAARAAVDDRIAALVRRLEVRRQPEATPDEAEAPEDDFRRMELTAGAIERSEGELGTPRWAIQIGVRQIALYNEARGRRDLKKLQGTQAGEAALWELRHHDARHPVRVMWRYRPEGPRAIAIMVKDDEDDQRRVIERILDW